MGHPLHAVPAMATSSCCTSPSSLSTRSVAAASASSIRLIAKPTCTRTQYPMQFSTGIESSMTQATFTSRCTPLTSTIASLRSASEIPMIRPGIPKHMASLPFSPAYASGGSCVDLAGCRDGRLAQCQPTVVHRDLRLAETGQPILFEVACACFKQNLVLEASACQYDGIDRLCIRLSREAYRHLRDRGRKAEMKPGRNDGCRRF